MTDAVRPFTIDVPDTVLDDLRRRLRDTRWPDEEPVADWSQGVPLGYLQEVCRTWADEYDWRKREHALNRLDQFVTEIDGVDIHVVHQRSPNPDATPLVLTHGWPGSVVEFHRSSSRSRTRRRTAATATTHSTSSRPRCRGSDSRASPPRRAGVWTGSPTCGSN